MAILPACSAEKKIPLFPIERKLEDPGDGDGRRGTLCFFEGGRLEGPPLELPGPKGGCTPLIRAGRAGVGVLSRRSLFVCDSKA